MYNNKKLKLTILVDVEEKLWTPKNIDFLKFMVHPHRQRGLSQCGHFADNRQGDQLFCDSVWTSLWAAPLTTVTSSRSSLPAGGPV